MTARVQTVRGPVDAAALGPTSVHEHLLTVLDHVAFRAVDTPEGRAFADAPVTFDNRWWVRRLITRPESGARSGDHAQAVEGHLGNHPRIQR
jgi:predicted metal-dependent phosphotriesterase family hydrolase